MLRKKVPTGATPQKITGEPPQLGKDIPKTEQSTPRKKLPAGATPLSTGVVECGKVFCGKVIAKIQQNTPCGKLNFIHILVVNLKTLGQ